MASKKPRLWIGHLIRWLLITAALTFIARASYGPEPWKLTSVTRQALSGMELPDAAIVSVDPGERGVRSVLLADRENGLYHRIFVARKFGMLWSNPGGGSFRMPLDPGIKVDFRGGMTTIEDYRFFYYSGQINDPAIARLQVVWQDGVSQDVTVQNGLYQVIRALPARSSTWNPQDKLIAYDSQDRTLYELSPERNEIR
ncbi:hypothetical protein [Paenibacillus sp. GCM10012303]|jgi:hypothetical protein|uniref:hypothetical protein n=1 Tax=Paenibacillus sp. GCM10012303 TaxID=3317340 RepID=UPI00361CBAD3